MHRGQAILTRFRQDVPPYPAPERETVTLDTDAALARARFAWDTGEARVAEGDLVGGLAWLGRAHRMAPSDQNLAFALAGLRLRTGDAAGAAALFAPMARRHDTRDCWVGLASALHMAGGVDAARAAMQRALSACAIDDSAIDLARRIADASRLPGWCGLRGDGRLVAEAAGGDLAVTLDGQDVTAAHRLGFYRPPRRGIARRLSVTCAGHELLGSPIEIDAIRRLEGVVERTEAGVTGWAWFPANPALDPELHVSAGGDDLGTTETIVAREKLSVTGDRPLSRPRGFSMAADPTCPIHVRGPDGAHLLGSPLPARPDRPLARISRARPRPEPQPELPVAVIIPVHRGVRTTLACLDSVLASVAAPNRIIAVDDATPEPELAAALDRLAASGQIILVRPAPHALGFPAACNAGMKAAAGCHIVLLNSDTLVAPGWLESLRDAACSAPDIGTATPLSNEASIFSFPDAAGGNPAPDLAGTTALASLARRANDGRLVDVPTAHGFCMFVRRDCLAATGPFDAALFAQGYGEENDFSERARALGFRHVAVPGVFVAHLGGASFGIAGQALLRRNFGLLRTRHPDYPARVAAFIAADSLAPARRRLDAARWRTRPEARAPGDAVLLVTHGAGGGTARVVAERAAALRAQGRRPIVLLARKGRCEVGDAEGAYPNLAYVLPAERAQLQRLLASERPAGAELHHLLGHDHSLLSLLRALGVAYDIWVHDYGWFCARLSFVTGEGRFCGEAPASVCEACIAEWGRGIEDPVAPAALRARSAADFAGARRVVVPSADVGRRVARHVPGVTPVVEPWEPPADTTTPPSPGARGRNGRRRVAVIGAIGLEKGVQVLLACAQDAALRRLALDFVVVGYTSLDDELIATERVFITGEFVAGEAETLIRAQGADLAFLPSVWPETWCFALSDAWRAGLPAAVFDIGTPALRVRQSGRGWVLPLGLPAPRVNDVLLAL